MPTRNRASAARLAVWLRGRCMRAGFARRLLGWRRHQDSHNRADQEHAEPFGEHDAVVNRRPGGADRQIANTDTAIAKAPGPSPPTRAATAMAAI